MSNIIERSFNNLVTGKVFSDFNNLPYEGQKRVAIKTALVAVAAGLLTGLAFGAIPAIIFAGVVGIAAFSYAVTRYQPADFIGDVVNAGIKKLSNQKDVLDDLIDLTVDLYNKAERKVINLINKPEKKHVQFNSVAPDVQKTARLPRAPRTQKPTRAN